MRRPAKRMLSFAAILLLFMVAGTVRGAAPVYNTIAVGMARSAAMGYVQTASGVTSMQGIYNPATLFTNSTPEDGLFDIWFDPVGLWVLSHPRASLSGAGAFSAIDWMNWGGLMIRGIGGRYAALSFAAIINEALPQNPQADDGHSKFPIAGVLDWQFSQTLVRVKMAEAFSLGASVYMVTARGQAGALRKFGGSYGVLISPASSYSVGIMYIDVPNETAPLFMAWNRTVDEAMNVGISVQARKNLLLSLDVRNVSEENQAVKRELHAGSEWQPWSWLSLRSGFFRLAEVKESVFSGGFALCNLHRLFNMESAWFDFDFTLDYGMQIQQGQHKTCCSHFLTISTLL